MLPRPEWPYAIGNAIEAELYRWDTNRLGVAYTYTDNSGEAGPVGTDDWPVIRRLERAGKLTFRDDATRKLAAKLVALGLDQ